MLPNSFRHFSMCNFSPMLENSREHIERGYRGDSCSFLLNFLHIMINDAGNFRQIDNSFPTPSLFWNDKKEPALCIIRFIMIHFFSQLRRLVAKLNWIRPFPLFMLNYLLNRTTDLFKKEAPIRSWHNKMEFDNICKKGPHFLSSFFA
jgi:hypothetical protein